MDGLLEASHMSFIRWVLQLLSTTNTPDFGARLLEILGYDPDTELDEASYGRLAVKALGTDATDRTLLKP